MSTLTIPTHASGGSTTLIEPIIQRPAFEHDENGQLVRLRWNGDDRGVIGQGLTWQGSVSLDDGRQVSKIEEFEALMVWEGLIRSKEAEFWSALEPGRALSS